MPFTLHRGLRWRSLIVSVRRLPLVMNTQASPFMIVRLIVASFVCLLILAIAVPSLGSVSLPNHKIGYGWRDALSVATIVAPLVVILIGAACSKITEVVGWVLLFVVVVLCIIGMATI